MKCKQQLANDGAGRQRDLPYALIAGMRVDWSL